MQPDLITVCVGMNDATLPGSAFERALVQLDVLHAKLAESGAAVVTTAAALNAGIPATRR